MHYARRAAAGALLALCALPAIAQEDPQDYRAFQLFNNCAPFPYFVGALDAAAAEIGLTGNEIADLVETGLRVGEIPTGQGDALLLIRVAIHDQVFVVRTEFAKPLYDIHSDGIGYAPTWSDSQIGSPAEKDFVLSNVVKSIEIFVSAYREVNAEACSPA